MNGTNMRRLMTGIAAAAVFGLALGGSAILSGAGVAPASAADKARLEDLRLPVVKIIKVSRKGAGVGTGFFIAPGIIATNRHVIGTDKEARLFVLLRRGGKPAIFVGKRIAESGKLDLAIIKVPLTDHATLKITTNIPDLDHPVYSIGYPAHLEAVNKVKLREALKAGGGLRAFLLAYVRELEQTNVTKGTVSKVDMSNWGFPTPSRLKVIFHTTKISGGNSGGPLVDRCGRVIGVNTRVLTAVRSAGTKDATFAAYSQASRAEDLVQFLKQNNVPHTQVGDRCVLATAGAAGPAGVPIYLWAVIGLVGLLALSSMGFAIVAPRRAKQMAASAGGAMTQMTRRMGTVVNRPTAPRIKEIRIVGEGVDLQIETAGLLKGYVIGRDQTLCDAVLTIGNASRRHFRIRHRGGRAVIEDLSSTNGTSLDGQVLKPYQSSPLKTGSKISIGQTDMEVTIV